MSDATAVKPDAFAGLPPIFEAACDPDGALRYDLGTPFTQDGRVYATDGKILVWTTAEGRVIHPDWEDPERRRPSMAKTMEPLGEPSDAAVPLPPLPDKGPCRECEGKGWRGHCPCCGEDLGEHGRAACRGCKGTGLAYSDDVVAVGRTTLAVKHVELFKRFGVTEVRLGRTPVYFNDVTLYPVHFAGEGFEGWLMPRVDSKGATP